MKKLFVLLVLALAVMSSFRGKGQTGGCTGLCSLMIAQLEASSAVAEKPRLSLELAAETGETAETANDALTEGTPPQ